MVFPKKYLCFAFIIVSLFAIGLNEWNRYTIIKENPKNIELNDRSLLYNSTVYSVDNEWYLPQIKNLLNGKGSTSNPEKKHYDVRRTPVYPMFYGFHYLIFGEEKSYYFIRITQVLLHSLATIALLLATFNFTKNKKIAVLASILYGFNPTLVSYLYFTITEALSPALVCFFLYFLSRCYVYGNKKDWYLTGFFFAISSLCRPSVFFILIALLFAIFYINRKSLKNIFLNGLLVVFGAGTLFVPHVFRNYIVTNGDFILLEKYYGDPMNFGMPNIELRNWISCWMNPADYSSEVISAQLINAVLSDSIITKEKAIDIQIKRLPARATLANKKEDITAAYLGLYDYYFAKIKHAKTPILIAAENNCISKMKQLKIDFIRDKPVEYYFITPILVIKSIVFQSNASTLAILDNYHTSYYKKSIKIFLYLLNVFLFISLIGNLFYIRKYLLVYVVCALFTIVNFTYIIFVIKYFEARYLVPIFPCLFISAAIFFIETITRINKIYTSR